MKLYKLTTQDNYTRKGQHNETLWGENVTHSGTGKGDLCGPGYIHAYTSPALAVFLNPIHASLNRPKLWECEGEIAKSDFGLKVGCVTLTTVREIAIGNVTTEQRIKFALLCALEICADPAFNAWAAWARSWLSGEDRTQRAAGVDAAGAAWAAARAADAAARAAVAPLDLIAIAHKAVTP